MKMPHLALAAALSLSVTSLVGCKREPAATPPAASPSAPAASPSAPAVSPAAAGNRKMANCPSSVAGAKTAFAAIEGGVEVTITATSAEGTAEVRARAKHLAEVAVKDPSTPTHSGEGEGGGMLGQCPVVLNDTALAVADVDNGAKVTVKPNKAENLEWLKKEVEARTAKLGH